MTLDGQKVKAAPDAGFPEFISQADIPKRLARPPEAKARISTKPVDTKAESGQAVDSVAPAVDTRKPALVGRKSNLDQATGLRVLSDMRDRLSLAKAAEGMNNDELKSPTGQEWTASSVWTARQTASTTNWRTANDPDMNLAGLAASVTG